MNGVMSLKKPQTNQGTMTRYQISIDYTEKKTWDGKGGRWKVSHTIDNERPAEPFRVVHLQDV